MERRLRKRISKPVPVASFKPGGATDAIALQAEMLKKELTKLRWERASLESNLLGLLEHTKTTHDDKD